MPDYLEQLCERLLKLGCPTKHVRRLLREVADHREDLKQAGLTEGLSEADAGPRADTLLGDPLALAEQMMTTVQRSSWWGRHYVVTFALLPVLAYPVLWALLLVLNILAVLALGWGLDDKKLHVAANNPITFHHILLAFKFMDYLGIALVALLFCWLAQRAVVKFKWMMIASAICSLLAVICWAKLERAVPGNGTFTLTVGGNLDDRLRMPWLRGTIPLLIACAFYTVQRWKVKRFDQKMARCE